jgi:hypothetical protein
MLTPRQWLRDNHPGWAQEIEDSLEDCPDIELDGEGYGSPQISRDGDIVTLTTTRTLTETVVIEANVKTRQVGAMKL